MLTFTTCHWARFVILFLSISTFCHALSREPIPTLEQLQSIHADSSESTLRAIFDHINIPRQVGTTNHSIVSQYIYYFLNQLDWDVECDTFTESTVIGEKTFRNIIASFGSSYRNHLVLACHYDSLNLDGFEGSIDSAMPCSILLKLASVLTPLMQHQLHYSLVLLFLDGEEAFVNWSHTDSLYGARHLAEKWAKPDQSGRSELSRIELFVLLDLIGAKEMIIPYYATNEPSSYGLLSGLEHTMRSGNLLRSRPRSNQNYFGSFSRAYLQDDHIPFQSRNVPILHIIAHPFPDQWHTLDDNADHIDWTVSLDMFSLMNAFARTYLHLI